MRKIQLSIVGVFFMLCSCTEQITPTPYSYTKVFTGENSKTWVVKFLEFTINGEVDDTFTLECDAKHLYTFYANGERSYKAVAGSDKCSADDADVITDSWSFNNASATLTIVLPFFTDSSLPFIVREGNTTSYRIHFESTDED
jgi:hypothetical protein